MYYHKFRLVHPDSNGYIVGKYFVVAMILSYKLQDAAAAALFTACKIEDTLKKSREILCAAYNMKLPTAEQLTPDDPVSGRLSRSSS